MHNIDEPKWKVKKMKNKMQRITHTEEIYKIHIREIAFMSHA